jgi:hypothetical protein
MSYYFKIIIHVNTEIKITPRKTTLFPPTMKRHHPAPSLLTTPYAKCKYIVMGAAEDDSSSSKQQMGLLS